MRGGALVVAAGNMTIMPDQFSGGLGSQPVTGGLQEMLQAYGFTVENTLVLDPQNEPFPIPVVREVGGFQVQEIQALDYPLFVDIRSDGMAANNPIVSGLSAVTLNWASPITVDATKNAGREVAVLLQSTAGAWTQQDFNIQPDFTLYPDAGFAQVGDTKAYTLAVSARGTFESFFKGKPSPLEAVATAEEAPAEDATPTPAPVNVGTIEISPDTTRVVIIGSLEFIDDIVLQLSSTLSGDRYLNNLKLVQNAVAWTVEDLDLLEIRSRGTAARVLIPLTESAQSFWELVNYALALISIVAIGIVSTMRRRNEAPMTLLTPEEVGYTGRKRKVDTAPAAKAEDKSGDADADSEEVEA
jgi:ABC-2 type transport system permease protein